MWRWPKVWTISRNEELDLNPGRIATRQDYYFAGRSHSHRAAIDDVLDDNKRFLDFFHVSSRDEMMREDS